MPWPDLQRCEAECLNGSFMTLGPRRLERCMNRPEYVVTSVPVMFGKVLTDYVPGQMSMCGECFQVFRGLAEEKTYTFVRLLKVKA